MQKLAWLPFEIARLMPGGPDSNQLRGSSARHNTTHASPRGYAQMPRAAVHTCADTW